MAKSKIYGRIKHLCQDRKKINDGRIKNVWQEKKKKGGGDSQMIGQKCNEEKIEGRRQAQKEPTKRKGQNLKQ